MSRKLKMEPIHKFYICDQKCSCSGAERCGQECKHTKDLNHAKKSGSRRWKVAPNGDKWEVA